MSTNAYDIALEAAREQEDRAIESASQSIAQYSLMFVDRVAEAVRGRPRTAVLHIQSEARVLITEVDNSIEHGINQMVDYATHLWKKASVAEFDRAGEDSSNHPFFHSGMLTAAAIAAVLLKTSRWKTLAAEYIRVGSHEVALLAHEAIRTRMDPDLFARKLRRYVIGAEPLKTLFNEEGAIDLRTIPRALQESARTMVFNSRRIAFSEIHEARALTEVRLFIEDPLVESVQWALSPNRGNWTPPDECDLLASVDWYGLGRGVFPVRKVPRSPHPFDRCERLPNKRSVYAANDPKPNPHLVISPFDVKGAPIPDGHKITARAAVRARTSAYEALTEPLS